MRMWVRIGIVCLVLVCLLDISRAAEDEKEAAKSRVKRASLEDYYHQYGSKNVVHRIIDEHNDHGYDDYDYDSNFFGDYHGGGHDDYHDDDYGNYHDDGHDYDPHSDYHGGHEYYGGGDFQDYVHGNGGYGKMMKKKQPKYRVVSGRKGYKKIYKPKVVVIQKIVPLSTTTMPTG